MIKVTCLHLSSYECAECREQRCMECDVPTHRDEIKTAVRYCPRHRWAGVRGFPQPDCNCEAIKRGLGESDPMDKIGGHEPDCIATNTIVRSMRSITTAESLDRFRTIAFGIEVIHDALKRAAASSLGGHIDISMWFLGIVPECYRPQVEPIVARALHRYIGLKAEKDRLHEIAGAISSALAAEVSFIDPAETTGEQPVNTSSTP